MFTEIWQSLKDNVKRRATNPFLGTFTIVYIVKNWELFYSIFNFDSELKLQERLIYIRKYFEIHNFFENAFWCILYAFAVLISTYLLLSLGRLMSNVYESIVTPWIYKITDKSKIVLKEEHEIVKKQRSQFESNYEKEHESRIKMQGERDAYESKYIDSESKLVEAQVEVNNFKATIESISLQLKAKSDEIESLKKQNIDKDNQIKSLLDNINLNGDSNAKFEERIREKNNELRSIKRKNFENEKLINSLRKQNEEIESRFHNRELESSMDVQVNKEKAYEIYKEMANNIKILNNFERFLDEMRSGELFSRDYFSQNHNFQYFESLGLFFLNEIENNYFRIVLTPLGREVKKIITSNI